MIVFLIFFQKTLDDHGLVDIVPSVIIPTWTNRRFGSEKICKHLDRLMIYVDLLEFELCFRQWVGCGGYSDHHPVFLQILGHDKNTHSPFKFNAQWLEHEDLVIILKNTWRVYDENSNMSPASQFPANLKRIKDVSICWSVKEERTGY